MLSGYPTDTPGADGGDWHDQPDPTCTRTGCKVVDPHTHTDEPRIVGYFYLTPDGKTGRTGYVPNGA